MAHRRCLGALGRHCRSLLSSTPLEIPRTLTLEIPIPPSIQLPLSHPFPLPSAFRSIRPLGFIQARNFSSRPTDSSDDEDEDDDDDDDDDEYDEGEVEDKDEDGDVLVSRRAVQSGKTQEEKVKEAAEIGYTVTGSLEPSERPFKPWEPFFAVVQIGSHQFKVSNGDSIFTEKLKYCDVNDKLILNKVLMLGSRAETIIGRPILPDSAVHAVVEEHALDAKVIIFKKKRRKNYRRTNGHRQELTKLRITDIQGIDKAENIAIAA